MKYIVILGDGMADYAVPELGNLTPLEAANKPNMDFIAKNGMTGLVKTVPEGYPPGSDTANLSAIGYDPRVYYSGRSPLEAVSMGIDLDLTDVTYRCNLVTLSDAENYEDCVMIDYSCDEIPTTESKVFIDFLNEHFKSESVNLYAGISYRHCLVLKNAETGAETTPPHDILDRKVTDYLPKAYASDYLYGLMKTSRELLKNHPLNADRVQRGLKPVSSVWLWGEGRKPALSSFKEKYGLDGAVLSAVDLIKGIGLCAGLDSIDVEGATGNIHTNFDGKAKAAMDYLDQKGDFIYVHIEAPDECGHRMEIENKKRSIELIDEKIVGPMMAHLNEKGQDYSILVLPDHPTPLSLRTHTSEPVPFALYRSTAPKKGPLRYTESYGKETGIYVAEGHTLLDILIKGE